MINISQVLSYSTEIKAEINHSDGTKVLWHVKLGCIASVILNTELHKSRRVPVAPCLPFFFPVTASFWKKHARSLPLPLQYSPPLIPPRGEVNAADAFDIGSFDEEDTKGIKVRW